ncbi:MAG: T9SS type A sorting domain-containing protein [Flavobacteriales bacterium]|nr:T9SS type A sorting domain-containing protein [Flavobacteriales bacterium]
MKKKLLILVFAFTITISVRAQIQTVLSQLDAPVSIETKDSIIFFAEGFQGSIKMFNYHNAVPVVSTLITSLASPGEMVIMGDSLFILETGKISLWNISSLITPSLIRTFTGTAASSGLAVRGNEIYFSENQTGKIRKFDMLLPSPSAVDVLTGLNSPGALAFKGNELYFAHYIQGVIYKYDVTSTATVATTVLNSSFISFPLDLFFEGNDLYMIEFGSYSEISKMNTVGFPITTTALVGWLNTPNGLIKIGNDIYFTERTGGMNPSLPGSIKKFTLLTTGIEDLSKDQGIEVYPNPFKEEIYLTGLRAYQQAKLYDATGRLVKELNLFGETERIVTEALRKGIYFLKVDEQEIIKLIKD